jgi:flagella basal body P-ring formation protein FlgA
LNKLSTILGIIFFVLMATVNLTFAKSTFSGERLREACLEYIQSVVNEDSEINVSSNIQAVEFSDDDITAQCVASAGSLRGNCYITIEFLKDAKLIRRMNVPVQVKIFALVPVAFTNIKGGGEFTENNIKIERKEVTNIKSDDVINQDYVFGQSAKRNVNNGMIITKSMLDMGFGIKRGEKVVIVAVSGAISVKSMGVALNDAEVGQDIRVKRDGINAVLTGTVSENKQVLIKLN